MHWLINEVGRWKTIFLAQAKSQQEKLYAFFSLQKRRKTDQQPRVEESICSNFGCSQQTRRDASANLSIYMN